MKNLTLIKKWIINKCIFVYELIRYLYVLIDCEICDFLVYHSDLYVKIKLYIIMKTWVTKESVEELRAMYRETDKKLKEEELNRKNES